MKKFIVLLIVAMVFLLVSATAFADPAPDDNKTNSVSPIVLEISSDSSSE